MKELEQKHADKEQVVVAQHKTLKLVAQQQFVPGLPLWSLDVKTREIKKVQLLGKKIVIKEKPKNYPPFLPFNPREVVYDVDWSNPNLVFLQALNKKNAARKFGQAGL